LANILSPAPLPSPSGQLSNSAVLESSLKMHKRHFEPSNCVGPFVNAKRTRKGAPELPAFEIEHFDHSNPASWQNLMDAVKMQSPDDRPHQGVHAPSASVPASLLTPEWSALLQAHAQAEAHAHAQALVQAQGQAHAHAQPQSQGTTTGTSTSTHSSNDRICANLGAKHSYCTSLG
jgi:hypothetical protein